jgi:hypothetical protein
MDGYNRFMSKRLLATVLLSCSLLFAPALASADDVPTDTPSATDTPAPTATPNPAAGLGPQSTGSAGGSNNDSSTLQPAGGNPLQSTTNDSTGLTAPNANSLQVPATSEQTLRVLDGEADGGQVPMDPTPKTDLSWLWFSLGFGVLIAAGTWLTRRARWAQPFHRLLHRLFAWDEED